MAKITAKECNYILNNYIPTTRDPAESYLISLAQAYLDHEAQVAELQEQIIIRDIIVNGAVEENNSLEAELAELRSENERLTAERDKYKDALEDMTWQFAYRGNRNGKEHLNTGGLSALELAFDVLGWTDPISAKKVGL